MVFVVVAVVACSPDATTARRPQRVPSACVGYFDAANRVLADVEALIGTDDGVADAPTGYDGAVGGLYVSVARGDNAAFDRYREEVATVVAEGGQRFSRERAAGQQCAAQLRRTSAVLPTACSRYRDALQVVTGISGQWLGSWRGLPLSTAPDDFIRQMEVNGRNMIRLHVLLEDADRRKDPCEFLLSKRDVELVARVPLWHTLYEVEEAVWIPELGDTLRSLPACERVANPVCTEEWYDAHSAASGAVFQPAVDAVRRATVPSGMQLAEALHEVYVFEKIPYGSVYVGLIAKSLDGFRACLDSAPDRLDPRIKPEFQRRAALGPCIADVVGAEAVARRQAS